MNLEFAYNIIKKLTEQGIETFCYCPSSRNSPFVEILTHSKGLLIFRLFDERSMGFFALGRAKRDGKPVVVVTTSGTAVFELYPSLVESYFTNHPLVLITCDRPSSYRGTGAPQSVIQTNIFASYVEKEYDLESKVIGKNFKDLDIESWNQKKSIHINVCFDDPLLDEDIRKYEFLIGINKKPYQEEQWKYEYQKQIEEFLQKSKKPVVIVGGLPFHLKNLVKSFLQSLSCPLYLEPLSQLREEESLQNRSLQSSSELFNLAIKKNFFDGILRIGAIPVLRFWRDLNDIPIPVLSISMDSFSGLKNQPQPLPLISFLKNGNLEIKQINSNLIELDATKKDDFINQKFHLLRKEGEWIKEISLIIPKNSHVFLGNSLPIREWNQFATRENKDLLVTGNRGANGIDGILSTFFGLCDSSKINYCILGDLSLMYDLSAPWILNQLKKMKINIIVINNYGGQIFKEIYNNPVYVNSHSINFKGFADMWNLDYQCLSSKKNLKLNSLSSFIEIQIK